LTLGRNWGIIDIESGKKSPSNSKFKALRSWKNKLQEAGFFKRNKLAFQLRFVLFFNGWEEGAGEEGAQDVGEAKRSKTELEGEAQRQKQSRAKRKRKKARA